MEEERLYDVYAIEEDIKILKKYLKKIKLTPEQLLKSDEIIKFIDYKQIQAIEHLIEAYRKVKKENRELKDMVDFRVKYCNELEEKIIILDEYYIPKSKIKEKIEEIKLLRKKEIDELGMSLRGSAVDVLQELLEEE